MRFVGNNRLVTNTGYPYAGSDKIEFGLDEVVAFGKLSCWGDRVTRQWVRLEDGRELIVHPTKMDKERCKALRWWFDRISSPCAPRGDFVMRWTIREELTRCCFVDLAVGEQFATDVYIVGERTPCVKTNTRYYEHAGERHYVSDSNMRIRPLGATT